MLHQSADLHEMARNIAGLLIDYKNVPQETAISEARAFEDATRELDAAMDRVRDRYMQGQGDAQAQLDQIIETLIQRGPDAQDLDFIIAAVNYEVAVQAIENRLNPDLLNLESSVDRHIHGQIHHPANTASIWGASLSTDQLDALSHAHREREASTLRPNDVAQRMVNTFNGIMAHTARQPLPEQERIQNAITQTRQQCLGQYGNVPADVLGDIAHNIDSLIRMGGTHERTDFLAADLRGERLVVPHEYERIGRHSLQPQHVQTMIEYYDQYGAQGRADHHRAVLEDMQAQRQDIDMDELEALLDASIAPNRDIIVDSVAALWNAKQVSVINLVHEFGARGLDANFINDATTQAIAELQEVPQVQEHFERLEKMVRQAAEEFTRQ